MVETWQIVVLAAGILVTVLTVYGGIIKIVYDSVTQMQTRFFGADKDGTDNGFVGETQERMTDLEKGQQSIKQENRMQSRLMTSIAYGIEDLTAALDKSDEVEVDLDHVRVRDDFMRGGEEEHGESQRRGGGGGEGDPAADGGRSYEEPETWPAAPWHGDE